MIMIINHRVIMFAWERSDVGSMPALAFVRVTANNDAAIREIREEIKLLV